MALVRCPSRSLDGDEMVYAGETAYHSWLHATCSQVCNPSLAYTLSFDRTTLNLRRRSRPLAAKPPACGIVTNAWWWSRHERLLACAEGLMRI